MSQHILAHTIPAARAAEAYNSSLTRGLDATVIDQRRSLFGLNVLHAARGISPWGLLLEQCKNVLVIILLIATVLSGFLGHEVEAITIAIIVLLAIVLGFIQEFRAEKAMEKLRAMAAPTATVIRDGQESVIAASELVPGDIILLSAGNRIPADARLVEAINLRVEEAALTGESLPSEKNAEILVQENAPLGDRKNMVYAGTSVAVGRAKAIVTATGMKTEFGKIATMLQEVEEEETPLQKNLDTVGHTLAKVALGIVVVISAIGFSRGESLIDIFIFGVALAVAVVPEALPAVVTISLAIGVQRMVRRHALIRKLPAVETLGCTSVICTDKTGTLTKDEMTIRSLWNQGRFIDVSGTGYAPIGSFSLDGHELVVDDGTKELLRAGLLSSDARLMHIDNGFDITGDPTEGALVVAAAKAGILREEVDRVAPRIGEIPFSSETKRMTTLHTMDGKTMAYSKGAPEVILPLCNRIWSAEGEEEMTEAKRRDVLAAAESMAKKALRVLALARKGGTDLAGDSEGMKFIGLVGMIDPPRPEVQPAIAACKAAGIRVIMITGDHPVTAEAIARELGILTTQNVVTGAELERMDEATLNREIKDIAVFARVSPGDKLRIVSVLQKQGHIAAMTGDGVNDAPALKKADIGVAMGITGTDVTKEAAAMTLTDDNFASIVAAIEEGRGIFGNIKKYLMYLLSSNIGEMIMMTVATLLGWPAPLSAVQILYLNLATDGFPALALAVDPPERDLMQRPPRSPSTGIFSKRVIVLMLTGSVWLATVTLGLYWWTWHSGLPTDEFHTMAFVLVILMEFFKAYAFRSDHLSMFQGLFSNRYLNIAILWEMALLIAIVYIPFFHKPFGTYPLTASDWMIVTVGAATIIPILECAKWIIRRQNTAFAS
jgi:Ca2+-transporting ATPase